MEGVAMIIQKNSAIEDNDIAYIHSKARTAFDMMSGNSLLLTGANGFLGYYLTKSILRWNRIYPDRKIRLSVLSTFRPHVPLWMEKRKHELAIIRGDVAEYVFPKKIPYDYIIHAASIASPVFYRKHPIETINANVQGMYRILQYCLERKKAGKPMRGVLYFSSSEIYGNPTKGNIPTPETYWGNVSCTGPRACYDESKRFCETLCANYVRVHDLPIKIARPFNNYGPGMKIGDGRVIADFAKRIIENDDIVMFSDGKPSRTFCYVADAVVGYFKILTKGKNGEAYNIGVESPEISVRKLATVMMRISKKEFSYNGAVRIQTSSDEDYLTDNPQRRVPVIKKAREALGYNPEIPLEEGLKRTLLWYVEQGDKA